GAKSGRDFSNALPADKLQAALDASGPTNTVWIGSGVYSNLALQWHGSGADLTAMKSLVGVDTGGGMPLLVSDFDRRNPGKTGRTLLTVSSGVSYVRIAQLRVEGHSTAIRLQGRHHGIRLESIQVTNARDGFWIDGGAAVDQPETGSSDLELRDCSVTRFTKRGFRVLGGNAQVRFIKCRAEAGGKEWAAENFPIGFHVLGGENGVVDRDITFEDCIASGAWHDAGNRYWNGDGFAAERATRNLTWKGCFASENTDGGWDLKTQSATLINCVSIGNKRNYRFWPSAAPFVVENCVSAYSQEHKSGTPAQGAWIKATATVQMRRCTFWQDGASIAVEDGSESEPTLVRLDRCLLRPTDVGEAVDFSPGVRCDNQGSILAKGGDPEIRLTRPDSTWHGGDDAFDSISHPGLGYRFALASGSSPGTRVTPDPSE
ncbi:MAG TPA: right-handed parallel beta-helix repeat-containing protein, partial [Clostridia bacterium]|nr:right-handed parallel beta-helix repeat-containing protein [Clostridia bacterium]